VVLPSRYDGGRVQVSHAGSTRLFDFATHSAIDICTIAWYNETSHNVGPITSGHQLTLIYDLIPTSSAFPRLPELQPAVSQLRITLQKWSEGHYTNRSGPDIIAIILTHKYDIQDLSLDMLRGEDRHRVSHISFVAEEMGYVVGLAELQYRNIGNSKEDLDRCESCEARNDEELANVTSTHIKISNLIDLAGLPMPGFAKLKLSKANLILDDPFEHMKPDKVEFHSRYFHYSNSKRRFDSDSDSGVVVRNFSCYSDGLITFCIDAG
jgi:hypothetical protein